MFGDNLDQLTAVAGTAETALSALPGLADVTNSLSAAPEVTIRPDSRACGISGLTTQQIGDAVRVAYQGAMVGKWAEPNGKERDVRVLLPADVRNQPGRDRQPAADPARRRSMHTLQQVATRRPPSRSRRRSTASIGSGWRRWGRAERRAAGDRHGGRDGGDGGAGTAGGHALGAAGTRRGAGKTRSRQLILGLAASIVLMYMVLTVLYESWLQPVLILTALPLATVGAFLGCWCSARRSACRASSG